MVSCAIGAVTEPAQAQPRNDAALPRFNLRQGSRLRPCLRYRLRFSWRRGARPMGVWTKFSELVERVSGDQMREREICARRSCGSPRRRCSSTPAPSTAVSTRKSAESSRRCCRAASILAMTEVRRLIKEAEEQEHEAVDLYRFTSILCARARPGGPQAHHRDAVGGGAGRRRGPRIRSRTSCGGRPNCSASRRGIA